MTDISDGKALLLKNVSSAIKRLAGVDDFYKPTWTASIEDTLSSLSCGKLGHLLYLFDIIEVDKKAISKIYNESCFPTFCEEDS